MQTTLYYVAGVALALCAVSVSFLGLRERGFAGSPAAVRLLVGAMATLVLVTTTGAVLNARHEQKVRRVKVREYEVRHKAEQRVTHEP